MGCARTFIDEDGEPNGFMCGQIIIPCAVCGNLCDYPMGKGKTCDAPLCCNHAIQIRPVPQRKLRVADDPDAEWIEFCPQHAAMTTG